MTTDETIRRAFRDGEVIRGIGLALRRGLVAFEEPREIRYDLRDCRFNGSSGNRGWSCGSCVRASSGMVRRVRAGLAGRSWRVPYGERGRLALSGRVLS